jgi:dephospho-CoA kinase
MPEHAAIGVRIRSESDMDALPTDEAMLIGLTGRNASGKSTLVAWFVSKGMLSESCSDSIRAHLREQGVAESRSALIEGGRELRRMGGAGILAEMLLERLAGSDAVIDSIRTPGEVEALRSREDFVLIEVRAGMEARWKRAQERARAGDALDRETFFAQEQSEAVAKDEAGQALDATADLADMILVNDSSIDELNADLEELWTMLSD